MSLVDGAVTIPLAVAGAPNPCAVVVKSYDLGYPDVREVKTDLPGQSGTLDLTTLHGARIVKLQVSIVDVPGVSKHETFDALRAACHPAHRPVLYAQCDGWAQQRVFMMRGQPASCVVGPTNAAYLEASLAWLVPSGVMASAVTHSVTLYPPASALTGVIFPVTFPLSWVPGSTVGIQAVVNEGTEPSFPVWQCYGMAQNVTLINRTTGDLFRVNVSIPDGHFVTVDMAARTACLDGNPALSVYGDIDFTVSNWWPLAPGVNEVQLETDASDLGAQVLLAWLDLWV
jgi:hypothetical protein